MQDSTAPYTIRHIPNANWNVQTAGATTIRHRIVAFVKTRTVIHVEEFCNSSTESSYTSRILIGNLLSYETLEGIPAYQVPVQNKWCATCFTDGPNLQGTGGVDAWGFSGRYFNQLHYFPACRFCERKPVMFDSNEIINRATHAYVFWNRAGEDEELRSAVEDALRPRGILATFSRRARSCRIAPPLKEELVAEALAPRRIEALLASGGFEALDAGL